MMKAAVFMAKDTIEIMTKPIPTAGTQPMVLLLQFSIP
jgi:hypothetical protein